MEDDLKIWKVKYLSNHWSDFPQILNLSLGDQTKIKNDWNEDELQWKMTSKYQKLNISVTTDRIFLKFETKVQGNKPKSKMFQTKTTSSRRWPQNSKSWISQQPLTWSSSNLKLKLTGPNQNKKCLQLRQPPIEDDLIY